MIKKIWIKQFGGIVNREVQFEKGLNVLFGPNETGKSTLIEALYALLWVDSKLGQKKVEDRLFAERAFPYGVSQYAECELEFEFEEKTYKLHKIWHHQTPKTELWVEGQKIMSLDEIEALMKRYLSVGMGTYQHVIFAKQDVFKQVFEKIKGDEEAYHTTAQLLKDASMELGGLPLDRFRLRVEALYDDLASNWDLEKHVPLKQKNWLDPHKKNVGKILEAHYDYEKYHNEYLKSESTEKELEQSQARLRDMKAQLEHIDKQLQSLSGLEMDAVKRTELEGSKRDIEQKTKVLLEINKRWPMLEVELQSALVGIQNAEGELEGIQKQIQHQQNYDVYLKTQTLISKRESLENEIRELDEKISEVKQFDTDVISELKQLTRAIRELKLKIDSSKLGAKITTATQPIRVYDAFDREILVDTQGEWQSEAFMKIELGSLATIEIQSLDFDFETVKSSFQKSTETLKALLDDLGVPSLEEALKYYEKHTQLINDQKLLVRDLKMLADVTPEERTLYERDRNAFEGYMPVQLSMLAQKREVILGQIRDLKAVQSTKHFEQNQYLKQFNSHDEVAEKMVELMVEKKEIDAKIGSLAPLPEQFSTIGDYLSHMFKLRQEKELLARRISDAEVESVKLLAELPDRTSIESRELFMEAQKLRDKHIKRAKELKRILDTLSQVVAQFENGRSSKLEVAFNEYVSELTHRAYENVQFQEGFDLQVSNQDKKSLPLRLLSSGTLDSVVIAFRLAMIRSLEVSNPVLTVLDDCLVNLDQKRKESAVNMIRRHAQDHQLIFVTCHEDVANLLEGHRLTLTTT